MIRPVPTDWTCGSGTYLGLPGLQQQHARTCIACAACHTFGYLPLLLQHWVHACHAHMDSHRGTPCPATITGFYRAADACHCRLPTVRSTPRCISTTHRILPPRLLDIRTALDFGCTFAWLQCHVNVPYTRTGSGFWRSAFQLTGPCPNLDELTLLPVRFPARLMPLPFTWFAAAAVGGCACSAGSGSLRIWPPFLRQNAFYRGAAPRLPSASRRCGLPMARCTGHVLIQTLPGCCVPALVYFPLPPPLPRMDAPATA